MERSKAGTKERNPAGLSLANQITILINIKWYYFTIYGKVQEIQLIINKIDLNYQEMTNHPPYLR